MFVVPPSSLLVFEVAVAISYDNDDGNIEADFERGAFKISCPLVNITLRNSPPKA